MRAAGSDPPAVVYAYAPGRGAEHAIKLLDGFKGILQVDGYAAYNPLTAASRAGGPVTLAFCWAHVRRKFYELHVLLPMRQSPYKSSCSCSGPTDAGRRERRRCASRRTSSRCKSA